ncbi:MAG: DUF4836 family protein [Prevotella sp.]|nr:DUF4836 family protein [Prevotella sp.]
MKKYSILFVNLCLVLALGSCSSDDYTRALPSGSTALMYVEGSKSVAEALQKQLPVDGIGDMGLDFSQKIYFFELADGNAGMCVRVGDAGLVEKTLAKLAENDFCKEVSEVGGLQTAVLNKSWVAAYDDNAFLVMFSVQPTEINPTKSRLVRFLKQNGECSEKFARLFEKLHSMKTPAAIVGRGQTLLKTSNLDLPQGVEPSQVLEAVGITVEKGVVYAKSNRFSFDEKTENALKNYERILRPIQGNYAWNFSSEMLFCVAMNVDGNQFLPMIQNEELLKPLLASSNAVIDMNNIIKSINGDVALMFSTDFLSSEGQFSIIAELSHSQWLADVGYWKTSIPKGGEIKDWGKNAYCYTDGKTPFYFGVAETSSSPKQHFFCGNTSEVAQSPLQPANRPVSPDVVETLKGSHFAVVMNMKKNSGIAGMAMMQMLQPFLGETNTFVYLIES